MTQPQLTPRTKVQCVHGHTTRTRQPPGTRLACTPCGQEGRPVIITVPLGPGSQPTLRPETPASPAGLALLARRRTGPPEVQCSGCHGSAGMSSPPADGEPAGWLEIRAGVPDAPEGRRSELVTRACSAECLAVVLPAVRARLAELPYAPPDRPSSAATIGALMREIPGRRR